MGWLILGWFYRNWYKFIDKIIRSRPRRILHPPIACHFKTIFHFRIVKSTTDPGRAVGETRAGAKSEPAEFLSRSPAPVTIMFAEGRGHITWTDSIDKDYVLLWPYRFTRPGKAGRGAEGWSFLFLTSTMSVLRKSWQRITCSLYCSVQWLFEELKECPCYLYHTNSPYHTVRRCVTPAPLRLTYLFFDEFSKVYVVQNDC